MPHRSCLGLSFDRGCGLERETGRLSTRLLPPTTLDTIDMRPKSQPSSLLAPSDNPISSKRGTCGHPTKAKLTVPPEKRKHTGEEYFGFETRQDVEGVGQQNNSEKVRTEESPQAAGLKPLLGETDKMKRKNRREEKRPRLGDWLYYDILLRT